MHMFSLHKATQFVMKLCLTHLCSTLKAVLTKIYYINGFFCLLFFHLGEREIQISSSHVTHDITEWFAYMRRPCLGILRPLFKVQLLVCRSLLSSPSGKLSYSWCNMQNFNFKNVSLNTNFDWKSPKIKVSVVFPIILTQPQGA